MEEYFEMSKKELERTKVLDQVRKKQITQILAAKILDISERHVRRLLYDIANSGDGAIISKKRGRRSNRAYPKEMKSNILELVSSYYPDFGPKLANEYLRSKHNINISDETLRLWMIEKHLWISITCQLPHIKFALRITLREIYEVQTIS